MSQARDWSLVSLRELISLASVFVNADRVQEQVSFVIKVQSLLCGRNSVRQRLQPGYYTLVRIRFRNVREALEEIASANARWGNFGHRPSRKETYIRAWGKRLHLREDMRQVRRCHPAEEKQGTSPRLGHYFQVTNASLLWIIPAGIIHKIYLEKKFCNVQTVLTDCSKLIVLVSGLKISWSR